MSIVISYKEELKRKAVHLSSLWIVASTLLLPRFFAGGRWIACVIFGSLLLLTLFSEHSYANGGKYLGRAYGFFFGKMLRKEIHKGQWIISGGSFVLAAALLVNILFVTPVAAAALAVMLTADAAAALIGRKFGFHRAPNNKSWEGVAAFIICGYIALAMVSALVHAQMYFYLLGIPAVILAAAAELFERQLHLDDNFSIPLCIGFTLSAGGIFFN